MELRNANIGIAVGGILLAIGCWLENWDVGQDAGAIIMVVSFVGAFAVTLALDIWDDRARDRR